MTPIDLFNVAAGTASLLSLGLSIWAAVTAKSARDIVERFSSSQNRFGGGQSVVGSGNVQAGGNIDGAAR